MKEYGTHRMVTTGQTVRIPNHHETETGHIRLRTPTYRKFVKRREKIETTRCRGTNIQVIIEIYLNHLFYRMFMCMGI